MEFGRMVTDCPSIVENILKYVNNHDLENCAKVCLLWKRLVEVEKEKRRTFKCFLQVADECTVHPRKRPTCSRCQSMVGHIEGDLQELLEAVKIHPRFCIAFATNVYSFVFLRQNLSALFEPPKKKRRDDEGDFFEEELIAGGGNKILKYLPDHCRLNLIVSRGIVGSRDDATPILAEHRLALSGVLFPQIPGLDIHQFDIDGDCRDVNEFLPADASVKCLLMFLPESVSNVTSDLVRSCLRRENGKVAIGGALAFVNELGYHMGTAIAFCGPRVKAASVILTPDDQKEGSVLKLKRFEETDLLNGENECFAFMFDCDANTHFRSGPRRTVHSMFHKLYPNIPLTGVIAKRGIGVNYVPSMHKNNSVDLDAHSSPQPLFSLPRHITSTEEFMCSSNNDQLHNNRAFVFVLVSIKT